MDRQRSKVNSKFLEVDEKTANKIRILCFLKGVTMKKFVTEAMQKEIEPYENWIDNVGKLKSN